METESTETGTEIASLEQIRKEKTEELTDLTTTAVRMEGDIRNTEREIESHKEQIGDTEQTIANRVEETGRTRQEIEELKSVNQEKESVMVELLQKKDSLVKVRDEAANEHQDVRGQMSKIEEALRKIRKEKDELLDSRHHMEMEVSEMTYDLKAIRNGIKKSYEVDLRQFTFDAEAEEQRFSKKQQIQRLAEETDDEDDTIETRSESGDPSAEAAHITSDPSHEASRTVDGDLAEEAGENNGTPVDESADDEAVAHSDQAEEEISASDSPEYEEQASEDAGTETADKPAAEYHEPTLEELLHLIEEVIPFDEESVTDELLENERAEIEKIGSRIRALEPVNIFAIEEYEAEQERLDFLTKQRQDLLDAEEQLLQTINKINETARTQFSETFSLIRENFIKIFTGLFEGGDADLKLELNGENDPLEANIQILARPKGKKIQNITLLSGGEKTLTAIALLFGIYLVKPSPFCILDEIDAPLDDVNIDKFTRLLKEFSKNTQFIIITHNKRTMEAARNIYGVSMQEEGVSKVISIRMEQQEELERHGVV